MKVDWDRRQLLSVGAGAASLALLRALPAGRHGHINR